MKKTILFLACIISPMLAICQTATVKGVVRDEGGKAVSNAHVRIEGTNFETLTDTAGSYQLTNVPFGTITIVIEDKNVSAMQDVEVNSAEVVADITAKSAITNESLSGTDEIPILSISSDEPDASSAAAISSELSASRDAFTSATSYTFSSTRFRIRGYESENSFTLMNGALITDLAFGSTSWSTWSGLNDAVRNREYSYGLRATNYSFGGIGGLTNIDSRASRQQKQLKVSYANTNRTYRNRIMATYGSGMNAKGWAFAVSYSRRWADEGYAPGSFYDGNSLYLAVDKKININNTVSLAAFGTKTKIGRTTASTQEAFDLAGTNYYNPLWGYQNGEKRNASVSDNFQPLLVLSHEWKINNRSSLQSAVTYQFGKYKISGIDWYEAEDPRPDYYRYLPSFDPAYGDDPVSFAKDSAELAQYLIDNPNLLQIDWEKIYLANKFSDTAKYVLANRVTDANRIGINTTYNNSLTDNILLSAGLSFQKQDFKYYKEIDDMLGGQYFLDLNQFADLQNANDSDALQNDLNNPNRHVGEGDRYGYDYVAHIQKTTLWAQSVFKYAHFDYYLGAQIELTQFYRTGNLRNGAFKDDSYGDSKTSSFNDPSVKAGVTYKYNGRNYFYVNGAYTRRAPLFRNAYVSPNTRNTLIDNLTETKITSVEGGYNYRAPRLKARVTGYLTQFKDQSFITRYYDGDFKTFVNTAITGIDRNHIGLEISADANLGKGFGASAVASIGQFVFNSRPLATVTQDNRDTLLLKDETVYLKNIRLGGTPQSAYSIGLNYRSPKFWYIYINLNYYDNYFVSPNVTRRTVTALDLVDAGSAQWQEILGQEKLDAQVSLDVSGGWSWKLNNRFTSLKRNTFLAFNIGISNVTDNKEINNNAYEQTRFDTNDHDITTFPTKYSYSFGRTYFASVTLRFN